MTLTTKQYLWTLRVLARGWQRYEWWVLPHDYVPSPRSTKILGPGWTAIPAIPQPYRTPYLKGARS